MAKVQQLLTCEAIRIPQVRDILENTVNRFGYKCPRKGLDGIDHSKMSRKTVKQTFMKFYTH